MKWIHAFLFTITALSITLSNTVNATEEPKNKINIKSSDSHINFEVREYQDKFKIVLYDTNGLIQTYNGTNFILTEPKLNKYILHIEFIDRLKKRGKLVSGNALFGNSPNLFRVDVSGTKKLFDVNSGASYLSGGGTGYFISEDHNTNIEIPKSLLNINKPVLRVTLEQVGLRSSKEQVKVHSRKKRSIINHDFSGEAAKQDVFDEINNNVNVEVSGFVSTSFDLGAINGEVTVFADTSGLTFQGGINNGLSKPISKPKPNSVNSPFSAAIGLAYHEGDLGVFENLGASVELSHFGLGFTVDDDLNITSDGFTMHISTDSAFSASGALTTDIDNFLSNSYFDTKLATSLTLGGALYWRSVIAKLNTELDNLLAIKDQVLNEYNNQNSGNSDTNNSSNGSDNHGSGNHGSDRPDRPNTGGSNNIVHETDLTTGETTTVDLGKEPVDAGTTDDDSDTSDNDSGWW
ncbi:hypothetical protein MHO82_22325 [Vibrio sp. Of7-15]|uniref:hypothetical protein n=1 Tax=Vibrio sp. Of7-15 TaxID=2724879 RepID=UPI001EF19FB7|nr:hypothetical protein [Vibrio sp. Of7-15]MCG7499605.1 hypothetical protein [Vibrio sp. Of7-15]